MAKNQKWVIQQANKYCCDNITEIEGYDEMMSSNEKWHTHHRREITEGKSMQQLIDEGLYWKVPSNELIFITASEHAHLHHKGKQFSKEHKRKLSEANKGRFVSDETRRKISEATKGRIPWDKGIKRDDIAGEKHPCFGKHLSEETRRKISEAQKGIRAGEKHPQARPVIQLTLDGRFVKEWSYGKEARQYGFDSNHISDCCRGKRPHHKGFKWMFADEYYTQLKHQKPIVIQLDLFIHNVS